MERSTPSLKRIHFKRTPINLHWVECLAPVFLRRETCGCRKPRLNVGGLQVHDPHFVFMVHILCSCSAFRAHDPHFVSMIHILCSWFGEHQPRSGLLQKTPLTEDQFLVVKTGLEPEAAASEYQVRYVFFRHGSCFSWLLNPVKVSLVSGHILS